MSICKKVRLTVIAVNILTRTPIDNVTAKPFMIGCPKLYKIIQVISVDTVSYTHLDVYKRQDYYSRLMMFFRYFTCNYAYNS